ncbi:hypothetical protein EV193_10168 [Herbihabitans rhizosphaerae]|uniref:PE family protein n=1 Tax=Herbihabitans rhizosphaerae TaxID=1872711 RepID=A0A4V2EUD5_9PSEU|nr:hypothetical protein [Herbihabitans rhizosphaerae]RZS44193.1 hypothetical protein EV193_10168 [Herbihabitans rhizosphaerae]
MAVDYWIDPDLVERGIREVIDPMIRLLTRASDEIKSATGDGLEKVLPPVDLAASVAMLAEFSLAHAKILENQRAGVAAMCQFREFLQLAVDEYRAQEQKHGDTFRRLGR